ncbi:hypothetical protein HPP92_003376 [Vanilla planifolia]|uniref:Uncharacterized protein n=1 Tax=Vanilla planifolia TaxID=51239 RepID=A0A835VJU4_VANPL|nr:hypothetical protein HPP92_003376 [Vanilla planifolia]
MSLNLALSSRTLLDQAGQFGNDGRRIISACRRPLDQPTPRPGNFLQQATLPKFVDCAGCDLQPRVMCTIPILQDDSEVVELSPSIGDGTVVDSSSSRGGWRGDDDMVLSSSSWLSGELIM